MNNQIKEIEWRLNSVREVIAQEAANALAAAEEVYYE